MFVKKIVKYVLPPSEIHLNVNFSDHEAALIKDITLLCA